MEYERGGNQKTIYLESEVERVTCPLCASSYSKELYKERGVLCIVRCFDCGLLYVNPRLKKPEEVYWGNVNAKRWPWSLYGVDPSSSLSEVARNYFGLNVKTAFLENAGFESSFFDVVAMTDVFEHIGEPGNVLIEVRRILKAEGILFIKVPNGSFNLLKFRLAKLTGRLKNYDLFDSYEHVVHYTHKTLCRMLAKYGFTVKKVSIGRPIQIPAWHKYVGQYYQYPSPWCLDWKRYSARFAFYLLSLLELRLRLGRVGYLAPNIIAIAKKVR